LRPIGADFPVRFLPREAAVRSGHVMILQQHLEGNVWYVHDGNSGGYVTRERAVWIAG
jgi:hypothetical protein